MNNRNQYVVMNKNKTHAGMNFRILKVLDCRAFWKRYTSQWNWWYILSLLLWRAGMVGNPVSYELGVIRSPFSVLLLTFSRFCAFICWLHLKCVPLNENHASRRCLRRNGQGEKSGSSQSLTLFLFLKRSSKFTASAESSPSASSDQHFLYNGICVSRPRSFLTVLWAWANVSPYTCAYLWSTCRIEVLLL